METIKTLSELPSATFGILGLAITIATFLPALVYSYSKDMLKNLVEPQLEEKEKIWIRIISFISTNDLILTQSMIQVFFSSIYGILCFTGCYVDRSIIRWLALIALILQWIVYFCSEIVIKKSQELKDELNHFWLKEKATIGIWRLLTLINLLITSFFIWILFFYTFEMFNVYMLEVFSVFFTSFLSFVLISYSVSWLIPLVMFSPLMSEVEDYAERFKESQKKETLKKKKRPRKRICPRKSIKKSYEKQSMRTLNP